MEEEHFLILFICVFMVGIPMLALLVDNSKLNELLRQDTKSAKED